MNSRRTPADIFNLSFLDVITCAFGAIIMLLLITRTGGNNPGNSKMARQQLARLDAREQQINDLSRQLKILNQRLQGELNTNRDLRKLQSDNIRKLTAAAQKSAQFTRDNKGLELVRQSLEISSALKNNSPKAIADIGGIPVDSDYVIFIIDTSGSMTLIWPEVMREIKNVLSIQPHIRGFQIMSDNGGYLMDSYAGQWISDSPTMRNNVISLMENWTAYSNSSPVEGLEKALRVYGHNGDKISIYVFGDDFTGNSFDRVVNAVARMNTDKATGKPLVKIDAIGFIHSGNLDRRLQTERKFSILMREITRRNGGAFVALPLP
ncbi:MAG: hypothetical protein GXP02_06315 [Alphaproteobacteria bacterium]|nr:hypothetical protein [Alphaproteobacteria bacterium]